jgi:hypothetical protein
MKCIRGGWERYQSLDFKGIEEDWIVFLGCDGSVWVFPPEGVEDPEALPDGESYGTVVEWKNE